MFEFFLYSLDAVPFARLLIIAGVVVSLAIIASAWVRRS